MKLLFLWIFKYIFFLLNIFYIYKYIYDVWLPRFNLLLFFPPSKALEFLQERDFETETFLCLDWNNTPWVCSYFCPSSAPTSIF